MWILVKTDNLKSFCLHYDAKENWIQYSCAVWEALFCVWFGCVHSENWAETLSRSHAFQLYPYVCSSLTPRRWHFFNILWDMPQTLTCDQSVTVQMFASSLPSMQEIRSDWISSQLSLPNIFVSFLFIDKNVNGFLQSFLSFKKSFYFVIVLFSSVKKCCWQMMKIIYQRN